MRRERRDRMWAERDRPHGLLRLGQLELSLEDGLAHRESADAEIEGAPPQASSSPILSPVAAMRLTIVRYGSSRMLQQFCEAVAGDDRGFLFEFLLRKLHAPRRIHREIPVFDRRFENAQSRTHELHPDRLPTTLLPELLRDPVLDGQPFDVPEPPVAPRWGERAR
jgi:hypothetical protein